MTVGITTFVWVVATFAAKETPERQEKLLSFYRLIKPAGPGWSKFAGKAPEVKPDIKLGLTFLAWILGCIMVYCALFGTGQIIYGHMLRGVILCAVTLACAVALLAMRRFLGWRGKGETKGGRQ